MHVYVYVIARLYYAYMQKKLKSSGWSHPVCTWWTHRFWEIVARTAIFNSAVRIRHGYMIIKRHWKSSSSRNNLFYPPVIPFDIFAWHREVKCDSSWFFSPCIFPHMPPSHIIWWRHWNRIWRGQIPMLMYLRVSFFYCLTYCYQQVPGAVWCDIVALLPQWNFLTIASPLLEPASLLSFKPSIRALWRREFVTRPHSTFRPVWTGNPQFHLHGNFVCISGRD